MMKYWNLIIPPILLVLSTGCVITAPPVANLQYFPTGDLPGNIGNRQAITLKVIDKRTNKQFGKNTAGAGIRLASSPLDIIRDGVRKALVATNFSVSPDSKLIYLVEIIEFDVQWPVGYGVDVSATISLDISLSDQVNNVLVKRRVTKRVSDIASGGGPDAGPVAKRVLSICLDHAINNSVKIPAIIEFLNKINSLERRENRKPKRQKKEIILL